MSTNADALAMFEQKKAAIGIRENRGVLSSNSSKSLRSESSLSAGGDSGNSISAKAFKPVRSLMDKDKKRRPKDSRTPSKPVCYLTMFLIGSSVGISTGICAFSGAYALFGKANGLLPHLWWISILGAMFIIVGVKSQMDSIRETVFQKKKDGKVVHLRVRRRHEVIMTLSKRVAIGMTLALGMGIGLHYLINHYKYLLTGVVANEHLATLPAVGMDVFFVLFSLFCTVIMLSISELSLRLTQKEGITYQAATIFLPATILCSLVMFLASTAIL